MKESEYHTKEMALTELLKQVLMPAKYMEQLLIFRSKALDSNAEGVDKIRMIKRTLESYGLNVTVGG